MGKHMLLVVENDVPVRNRITKTLERNDFKYETADNGAAAISEAAARNPDVILLDLGLPNRESVRVIEKLRSWTNTPIIVISAGNENPDKVEALDAGADDYLTQPFSDEELLRGLRGTFRRIRRARRGDGLQAPVFVNGDLKIDYAAGCAFLNCQRLYLRPVEYQLICLLARNVGKVLTYSYLAREMWGRRVWGNDVASLQTLISRLRKIIEPNPAQPRFIQTHVGIGYRMLQW